MGDLKKIQSQTSTICGPHPFSLRKQVTFYFNNVKMLSWSCCQLHGFWKD